MGSACLATLIWFIIHSFTSIPARIGIFSRHRKVLRLLHSKPFFLPDFLFVLVKNLSYLFVFISSVCLRQKKDPCSTQDTMFHLPAAGLILLLVAFDAAIHCPDAAPVPVRIKIPGVKGGTYRSGSGWGDVTELPWKQELDKSAKDGAQADKADGRAEDKVAGKSAAGTSSGTAAAVGVAGGIAAGVGYGSWHWSGSGLRLC